jgi:hemerythrin-like domain-containing protein
MQVKEGDITMKRLPELQQISMEHHQGLVFARKVKRAAASGDEDKITGMWVKVEASYETELKTHFQIEEQYIASVLEQHGETKLVKQLNDEHTAIRQIFLPECGRTAADLNNFGVLLEQHIRFEERVFLETAQKYMSSDELQAVANACKATKEDS